MFSKAFNYCWNKADKFVMVIAVHSLVYAYAFYAITRDKMVRYLRKHKFKAPQ